MSLAIRELGLSRKDLIVALVERFSRTSDSMTPAAAATAFLAGRGRFCFGAFDDDDPVGWAWGSITRQPDGRMAARIEAVDVAIEYRRRGIGALLLEAAIAHARRSECAHVTLLAVEQNLEAHALAESLGPRSSSACISHEWTFE